VVPGQPFTLRFRVDLGGGISGLNGPVDGRMTIHFEGMPPDAEITSCQGFVQIGDGVPASNGTWGRLKSRYR